jgi:hypothetical protein
MLPPDAVRLDATPLEEMCGAVVASRRRGAVRHAGRPFLRVAMQPIEDGGAVAMPLSCSRTLKAARFIFSDDPRENISRYLRHVWGRTNIRMPCTALGKEWIAGVRGHVQPCIALGTQDIQNRLGGLLSYDCNMTLGVPIVCPQTGGA